MVAQLKVELISPFVEAAKDTFRNFLSMNVRRRDLYLKQGYGMFGDISAIIGLSGTTAGTCAISMSARAAVTAVERMLMAPVEGGFDSPDIRDGVGELVNIVAGQAKATLSRTQYKFDLTLPTIISGKGHEFFQRRGTYCVVVLFETEEKEHFTLDLAVGSREQSA